MKKKRKRSKLKRRGRGARKGGGFERQICKALSLWVSGGKHEDLFWRSSMSGGRATVAHKRGGVVRQAGDICAVAPEGNEFIEKWYVECKFYKSIDLDSWIIKNTGKIAGWWKIARRTAKRYKRSPMLIVKQNGWPVLIISRQTALEQWTAPQARIDARNADISKFDDMCMERY